MPSWLIVLPALPAWIAVLALTPLGRPIVSDKAGRLASLDGLRGILALMVYAHHFAVTTQWQSTGRWELTASTTWNLFGQVAVSMFFMITGFLFFGKIRASEGRVNGGAFLIGRVLRLMPVYGAAVSLCIILAFAREPAVAWASLGALPGEIVHWLLFRPISLLGMPDGWRLMAGVPWSLRYEWLFYAGIPVIALMWSRVRFATWPFVVLLMAALWLTAHPVGYSGSLLDVSTLFLPPFVLGGCCSTLRLGEAALRLVRGPAGIVVVGVATAAEFAWFDQAYTVGSYLVLAAAFAPIALGNTLGGVLAARPFQMLGAISYDIYLVHGIVLYVAFGWLLPSALVSIGGVATLLVFTGCGLVVIATAILAHRLVEVPANRWGSRLVRTGLAERLAAP